MSKLKRRPTRKGSGAGFHENPFDKVREVQQTQSDNSQWIDNKVSNVKDKSKLSVRKKKNIVEAKQRLLSREYKFVAGDEKNPVGVFSDIKLSAFASENVKEDKKQFQNQTYGLFDESTGLRIQIIDSDRTTKTVDRKTKFMEVEGGSGVIAVKEYNKDLELLETNIISYLNDGVADSKDIIQVGADLEFRNESTAILENSIYNSNPNQSRGIARHYKQHEIRHLADLVGAKVDSSSVKTINNIREAIMKNKEKDQEKGIFVDKTGYFTIQDKFGNNYDFYNDKSVANPVLVGTNNPELKATNFQHNDEKKYKKILSEKLKISEKAFDLDRGALLIS